MTLPGVALSNLYPEVRSVGLWLRHGWHVVLATIISFLVMLSIVSWHPHAPHKTVADGPAHAEQAH